jgi:arylsulfatase A-like enzyme
MKPPLLTSPAPPLARPGAVLLVALLAGCSAAPDPTGSAPSQLLSSEPDLPPAHGRTNLLLVTIDTLRVDRMGAYGNPRDTTPWFDALASEGALFERVYAQRGSTWPSLVSILASQHPVTHGVRHNGQKLQGDPATLAHALGAQGYHCGAVLTNASDLGWQGFDDLRAVMQEPRDVVAADQALQWLEQFGDQPFFLWVHLVAPHDPYQPSPEHMGFVDPGYRGPVDGSVASTTRLLFGEGPVAGDDREQLLALYDGEVAWSDAQLGRLLEDLKGRGLLDHTLVAVSSDHGEELLDRQRYPFHNASIYEGSLRLPLALRLPGAVPPGTRHPELAASLDIAPTLLELLDAPIPDSFEGRSLVPLLQGEPFDAQPVFSELEDAVLSVRTPDWRYVHNPGGHNPALVPNGHIQQAGLSIDGLHNQLDIAPTELYSLIADPLEQRDLAARDPQRVAAMAGLIQAFEQSTGWRLDGAAPAQPLDPELRARLEAMGYVLP